MWTLQFLPKMEMIYVGEFKDLEEDTVARTLDCFGRKKSAMTHKSSNEKKSVTVHWVAPNDADAEYQVL